MEYYLKHHGIEGQKWGKKNGPPYPLDAEDHSAAEKKAASGNSGKYKKYAKKDAQEFARAKVSYGMGAGNKRKLINHTVKQRMKEDPEYKKEFEKYLNEQDMGKHTEAAKREHAVKEAKHKAGVVARGMYHSIMKDGAKVAVSVAAAYTIMHKTGIDKQIAKFAQKKFWEIQQEIRWQKAKNNNNWNDRWKG